MCDAIRLDYRVFRQLAQTTVFRCLSIVSWFNVTTWSDYDGSEALQGRRPTFRIGGVRLHTGCGGEIWALILYDRSSDMLLLSAQSLGTSVTLVKD
jgi:hypothetical protein